MVLIELPAFPLPRPPQSLTKKGEFQNKGFFPRERLVERMISRIQSHLRSVMSESGIQRLVSRIIDELCDLGKDHH